MTPFGRSFKTDHQHQPSRSASPASTWFHDKSSLFDEALNFTAQLPKFRQSDFASRRTGRVRVVVAALYPPERGFLVGNRAVHEEEIVNRLMAGNALAFLLRHLPAPA